MPPLPQQITQPGMPPQPGMNMQGVPPLAAMQPGLPPQPGMTTQPGVPAPLPGTIAPMPGPPTSTGAGIAGRRQYPQMVIIQLAIVVVCVLRTHLVCGSE